MTSRRSSDRSKKRASRSKSPAGKRRAAKSDGRDFVCEECFRDPTLRAHVRDNGELGNCSWCSSRRVPRVHIGTLTQAFRDVADYYIPTTDLDTGELIEWRFEEDWGVFGEEITASTQKTRELILRILEHGYHPKDDVDVNLYAYSGLLQHPDSWLQDRWIDDTIDALAADVRFTDRNGPEQPSAPSSAGRGRATEPHGDAQAALPAYPFLVGLNLPELQPDHLDLAFDDLAESIDADTVLFRAQTHEYGGQAERFDAKRLGAPPPSKTKSSRASRAGRSILYTASDIATAVAEVRAWKGAAVAVAEIRQREPVALVDLRHPNEFSPFFVEDLQRHVALHGLLWRLAEDMSYPVDPRADNAVRDRLYRPTQYLCERIEAAGYAGVIHASAAGPGHNVVFFDPDHAEVAEPRYLRVAEMRPDLAEMGPYEDLYEQRPYDPDAEEPIG